jgi:dTDP-4-amino-4,6-dideoxygalactose transaminase
MKIPFSPPYIDDSVINEVVDSLKSGWITTGPKVKALEDEIKSYSGSKAVLCVNSWTSGAIMILRWLGLKEGDEVIIPAYTYSATALSVIHAGGKPVMVDISDDFNITLDSIKEAITERTKAIIPVDIAGWPCDYKEIISLVAQDNIRSIFKADSPVQEKLGRILVLSDAAHSFGASYKGKKVGSECDITIFSLHAVKNVTTAEGGAICLNLPEQFKADELYSELRMLSLNCQTKDAFTKTKAGGWKYDIIGLGMKINMPDVNAAIGLAQIRQYANLLAERKSIALKYTKELSKYDWAQIPSLSDNCKESSYHLFALRINGINEEQRDLIIQEMSDRGIAVNVHFIPMPMLSFFKGLGYDINDFPKAYHNYAKEISLPIYPQLTNENIDYIVNSLEASYNKVISK